MNCGCTKRVASGSRTILLMREERCYGIANAKVSDETVNLGDWKRLELTSESLLNEIGTLTSAALNPERAVRRRKPGIHNPAGDISYELANNGYGWMITQAIGKQLGAGTTGDPYTIIPVDCNGVASDATAGYQQNSALYVDSEITYKAECSDCAGYESGYYEIQPYSLEPAFSLLLSRDGGTIKDENGADPTNHLWFQYLGCKVQSWSLSAPATEWVTGAFSIMARQEENLDMAVPTYRNRPSNVDPLSGFDGTVTIAGETDYCVLSFDMTVNNNIGTDQFCMGSRYRSSGPEGQRTIEGTIAIEFTDLVNYSKYVAGTSVAVTVLFDLFGDGTETLKIILPNVEYNGETPQAGGQEAITQNLPYQALWSDSASSYLTQPSYAPNGFDIAVEIVTASALV